MCSVERSGLFFRNVKCVCFFILPNRRKELFLPLVQVKCITSEPEYGSFVSTLTSPAEVRARLKRDGTRAETRFGLSEKWTSPFKSAGESVQSTAGSRGVRISGQTMDRPCSEAQCKCSGYPLQSPISPPTRHRVPSRFERPIPPRRQKIPNMFVVHSCKDLRCYISFVLSESTDDRRGMKVRSFDDPYSILANLFKYSGIYTDHNHITGVRITQSL